MTKAHADASPSSSEIWINCPASVTKARGQVRKSTPYTREGTAAHGLAESILNGTLQEGMQYPETIVVEGESIEVTPEMVDAVETYVGYVGKFRNAGYEARVHLGLAGEDIFGTVDAFAVEEPLLRVGDFKYGQGHDVPADASQLRIYALGVLQEIGPSLVTDVELSVIQPRTAPDPKVVTMPVEDLLQWETDILKPAVEKLAADDQTENPGDHCRWCVRAGVCRTLATVAQDTARLTFEAIPPDPETLTNEELAEILDKAVMVGAWISRVRGEASARADQGEIIPGWKLVPKRASRKWHDPDGMLDALQAYNNVNLYQSCIRVETITNVEKALKKAGIKKPADVVNEFTVKESSGSTLVSENDARISIDTDWRNMFQLEFDET